MLPEGEKNTNKNVIFVTDNLASTLTPINAKQQVAASKNV